jgi:transcriptional regulator
MRPNPVHACDDPDVVRELIRSHPWGTLVSIDPEGSLVASHYPILLDEDSPELAVHTHVGRPDEEIHGFGSHPGKREREVLLIVQGHHGYISPSWYAPGAIRAPTWNFTVAHCHGVPEVLDPEANLRVLTRLQAHFERRVPEPIWLDPEWGSKLARGTVGLRLVIARFECKRKLSLDKDPVSRRQAIEALRRPGPYHHPRLADDMERLHSLVQDS